MWRDRTKLPRLLVVAMCMLLTAAFLVELPELDRRWFRETLRDSWGAWVVHEDWRVAPTLPNDLDYKWLRSNKRPLVVAHALGASGGERQNTIAALDASLEAGASVLEVDVWLDKQSRLRCHHGPEEPPQYRVGDCELGAVLERLETREAFVVLDVKTNFDETGDRVVDMLLARGRGASKVVFQLYRPSDVTKFASWHSRIRLAGPAITAYRSHRSVAVLAAESTRLGIAALVVPLYRLPALGRAPTDLSVFSHPIDNCADLIRARRLGAVGIFVTLPMIATDSAACEHHE